MKCPKCGAEMIRVDIPKVEGSHITSSLECPSCHYRIQQEQ